MLLPAGCFDDLLAGTTCRVTTLNGNHDPNFGGINPEPIQKNYAKSAAYLKKNPHDICLVTDGDADRVGGMDGRGNYLTTYHIQVDGGINFQTTAECAHAGADAFVSGTGLFGQPSLTRAITKMRRIAERNTPAKEVNMDFKNGYLLATNS